MPAEPPDGGRFEPPATAPLRVAIDATPLLGRRTGVGVFCSGLLWGVARQSGLAVSAFAVSWRRRRDIEHLLPRGVRAGQRAMPARPLQAAWGRADLPPVEWFIGPAEVVHGTNFVVPPARRAATVLTVHDLTVVRYPELCDRATLVFPELVRRAVRRGAWVHTPSAFVAGEVIDVFGAHPDRVRAVPSGTPVVTPAPADAGPVPACPVALPPGTTRYVLAIGTAEPRKDLPGLVRAFEQVAADRSDLALVLVGQGGWGAAPLDRAIEDSAFGSRIVRAGWLDDPSLAAALGSAAALAYPSVYEGFGFPPLQAMAAGVPVVATRAGALPEVLGDAAVLVGARDADALAGALGEVLDSEDLRATLIARGAERAAGYTWDRCATGMAALYRDASLAAGG